MYCSAPLVAMDNFPTSNMLKIVIGLVSNPKIGKHFVVQVATGSVRCQEIPPSQIESSSTSSLVFSGAWQADTGELLPVRVLTGDTLKWQRKVVSFFLSILDTASNQSSLMDRLTGCGGSNEFHGHVSRTSLICWFTSYNWLLIAVTAERTIGVVMYHSVKMYQEDLFFVICGIIATLGLINSHILFGFNVVVNEYNATKCLAASGDYIMF
ncbi:LOW QUALITY PROTEIN: hypothetical protein MAR_011795 [Mya arenaria]|uniref:Uncharacterized protein n=1 Tax=Mya arenaria TaxID=6604 RepID=A0ABY7FZC1_MYAAR|nr:LOW QUALITY PROTEIN: hypothetical protein MAR_011795 [Mya arenaria]